MVVSLTVILSPAVIDVIVPFSVAENTIPRILFEPPRNTLAISKTFADAPRDVYPNVGSTTTGYFAFLSHVSSRVTVRSPVSVSMCRSPHAVSPFASVACGR